MANIMDEFIKMAKSISSKHSFRQDEYEICSYEDVFCGEKFFNVEIYRNNMPIIHFTTAKLLTTDEELKDMLNKFLEDLV